MPVGQDAQVIENALESLAASGASGVAGEQFYPNIGPEQISLPGSRIVQGPEPIGVEFFLGCFLKRGRRAAVISAWNELGVLDAAGMLEGDRLVLKDKDYDYELSMALSSSGLSAQEKKFSEATRFDMFGLNVTFEGQYRRVPTGGEALPQPEMRPFESEFWPEEGIPVFEAKCPRIVLRARPSSDTPVVGYLSTVLGSRIPFSGFRYRTLRPGRVVVHEEYTLTGRNLGRTDYVSRSNYYDDGGELVILQLQSNDRLEYLQYRAEGSGFIRWQGLVLDVEYSPWLGSNRPLELVVEPVTEAWIRVESESDMETGWILVNEEETVSEIGREF